MSKQSDRPNKGALPGFETRPGWRLVAALSAGLAMAYPASAVEAGVYSAPSPQGFAVYQRYEADGDGDGIEETHVVRYLSPRGDSLFSMTTGDRLWAWSLASQAAEAADLEHNYVIRDSDCDGTFDERYALDEEYHVPDCLKSSRAQ